MFNLKAATVTDGREKMALLGKYIPYQVLSVFQELIARKSLEWHGEVIVEWEFVDLGETFFMYPSKKGTYKASTAHSSLETDELTYGVALSCLCINHLSWWMNDNVVINQFALDTMKKLNEQFYFLRDFVYDENIKDVKVIDVINILD